MRCIGVGVAGHTKPIRRIKDIGGKDRPEPRGHIIQAWRFGPLPGRNQQHRRQKSWPAVPRIALDQSEVLPSRPTICRARGGEFPEQFERRGKILAALLRRRETRDRFRGGPTSAQQRLPDFWVAGPFRIVSQCGLGSLDHTGQLRK